MEQELTKKPYYRLLKMLRRGEENGIHARELAAALGIEPRDIRLLIALARQDKILIISGNHGYALPSSRSEVIRFVNRMRREIRGLRTAIRPAEAALQTTPGQMEFSSESGPTTPNKASNGAPRTP